MATVAQPKKKMTGIVVNLTAGKNTIKIRVERLVRHAKYYKQMKMHKNYLVHVTESQLADVKVGDMVQVEYTRPVSTSKNWKLISKA